MSKTEVKGEAASGASAGAAQGEEKFMSHFFTNVALAMLVPMLLGTVGRFSDRMSKRTAQILAVFVRLFYFPGMRLLRANLATAFPEMPIAERKMLARKNVFYTIWNWIDFIRILKRPERIGDFVESKDALTPLPDQVIFCLPHLGSWELLAQIVPSRFKSCAAVAEVFPYRKLNEILDHSRSINGLGLIHRKGAVKGAIAAVRQGTSVGMLIDQNLSPRHGGIFVEFFGLPVPCSPLPAILGKRYGVPLVSGACVRSETGKFRILAKVIDIPNSDDKEALTQAIISANEALIREYAEQYTWLYRRWMYIPADVPEEIARRFPYYANRKKYRLHG